MGQEWLQKEASLTNCCHETLYEIYLQCHLPTDINIIRSCHHEYGNNWQLTCISLSCLLSIWSMTNVIFMSRYWSVTYLLMNFTTIYHSILWKSPTSLSTYCHLIVPMLMCSLAKMHTQKCGNFEKTMRTTSAVFVSEHVWTMESMLVSDILNVTLTKMQT